MPKKTLKSQAYEIIKDSIIYCKYAPGSIITEDFLQSQLNVSRTPIREAINKLEQEGLVTVKSKKGIIVSPLSFEEAGMMYESRLLLEPYVIKTYGNRISQGLYVDFYKQFSSLLEAGAECDDFEVDDRFHQIFFTVSGNSYLIEMNNRLGSQNSRLRVLTRLKEQSHLAQTTKEHLAIVNACLQSNWEEAAGLCIDHLKRSRENSFKLILSGCLD